MPESPDVVLLRSADEPDRYLAAFRRAGMQAVCEPVLTFAFPSQEALADHLEVPDQYAALIATSPRVGTALGRLFADREDLAARWRGAPTFAVGPKTAERVREVGLVPRGADAGDAAALAEQIAAAVSAGPLLFLCGNRRRDTLPNRLREADLSFDELVVYETRTRRDLTLPPSPEPPESPWLVFFSPSGLEAVEQAPSVDPGQLHDARIAAIGPTTSGALEQAGWAVEAVAAEPSPEALLDAIRDAEPTS
jgi:uroporphyrinogen-III synthase